MSFAIAKDIATIKITGGAKGKMKNKAIVFCDTENKEIDTEYASKLRKAFRKQTGWKVKKGTRIYNDLTAFSRGYSREKRDVTEVITIFMMANGLMREVQNG